MSQEDQRTFKRWAKANAVVMLIFAVAFATVALGGSSPSFTRAELLRWQIKRLLWHPLDEACKAGAPTILGA